MVEVVFMVFGISFVSCLVVCCFLFILFGFFILFIFVILLMFFFLICLVCGVGFKRLVFLFLKVLSFLVERVFV